VSLAAEDVYRWLSAGASGALCEGFDRHVVGCVLSLALTEVQSGGPLVDSLGLDAAETCELARLVFPHAESLFARLPARLPAIETWAPAADEVCLRDLLYRGSSQGSRLEYFLSRLISRRAQRPNHLWQDLGLRHRRELSWLMSSHFEPIAAKNKQDMKWKKFLYRMICRDEGFAICTAPSCEECSDLEACFGAEAGESLVHQGNGSASQT
jgi:nitrogen fixation protein NifQ